MERFVAPLGEDGFVCLETRAGKTRMTCTLLRTAQLPRPTSTTRAGAEPREWKRRSLRSLQLPPRFSNFGGAVTT